MKDESSSFLARLAYSFLPVLLGLLVGAQSARAELQPRERAVQLVELAAVMVYREGPERVLREISVPDGAFVDSELYVFAYDLNGVMLAHPKNPKLVGKGMSDVPDLDGKMFRREIIGLARYPGSGWVNYRYKNPVSNRIESKTTWIRRVGNMILCCGVYLPEE